MAGIADDMMATFTRCSPTLTSTKSHKSYCLMRSNAQQSLATVLSKWCVPMVHIVHRQSHIPMANSAQSASHATHATSIHQATKPSHNHFVGTGGVHRSGKATYFAAILIRVLVTGGMHFLHLFL